MCPLWLTAAHQCLAHCYIYPVAFLACNEECIEFRLRIKKKEKQTQHSQILAFEICLLFFLPVACLATQKQVLFCHAYSRKQKCVCVILQVFSPSLLCSACAVNSQMISEKMLPWKYWFHYLWSAGVSTFTFYQAISHQLALQLMLFRIVVCFPDTYVSVYIYMYFFFRYVHIHLFIYAYVYIHICC